MTDEDPDKPWRGEDTAPSIQDRYSRFNPVRWLLVWRKGPRQAPMEPEALNEAYKACVDTIRRTMLTLLGLCLFAIASVLGASDSSLVAGGAKIPIPFANVPMAVDGFLFTIPLILLVVLTYMQVFIGKMRLLERTGHASGGIRTPGPTVAAPALFTLNTRTANWLSHMAFYWSVPVTLGIIWFKAAAPFGDRVLLLAPIVTLAAGLQVLNFARIRPRRIVAGILVGAFLVSSLAVATSTALQPDLYRRALKLEGIDLQGAMLSNADLRFSNLAGANLEGAKLNKVDLSFANLSRANLRNADLSNSNLSNADMRHAVFDEAHLQFSNITYARLENASLEAANLNMANLRGANLFQANLTRAKLALTDLTSSNLEATDLGSAIMINLVVTQKQLDQACSSGKPGGIPGETPGVISRGQPGGGISGGTPGVVSGELKAPVLPCPSKNPPASIWDF